MFDLYKKPHFFLKLGFGFNSSYSEDELSEMFYFKLKL